MKRRHILKVEGLPLVLAQIERERGISQQLIIEAIKASLLSACRKLFPEEILEELSVELDLASGNISVIHNNEDVTPKDFGRIATQSAKQVIMQKIREAEKNSILHDYEHKVGKIITGHIQRIEGHNYLINLGRIEASLSYNQQIHTEKYKVNDPIRVYLEKIDLTAKGPVLVISRVHTGLLACLMELEIPEILEGTIEIKAISRSPGLRAKVAVRSKVSEIGAVGTCVGHMGQRIQNIVKELSNERIDVIEWSDNPEEFISNSLKPAKATYVSLDKKNKTAKIEVPADQLSLAIGKGGVNIHLATDLCGWQLEIQNQGNWPDNPESPSNKTLSLKEKLVLAKAKQGKKENE